MKARGTVGVLKRPGLPGEGWCLFHSQIRRDQHQIPEDLIVRRIQKSIPTDNDVCIKY